VDRVATTPTIGISIVHGDGVMTFAGEQTNGLPLIILTVPLGQP